MMFCAWRGVSVPAQTSWWSAFSTASLALAPNRHRRPAHPDVMPPGGYDEAQTGIAPLGRYVIKVTVAAGTLSPSREFVFEPAKPKFAFMARPTEDGAKHGSVNPSSVDPT
jgi:hypothetical protein